MNVVIGLKDADFVIRELDPKNQSAMAEMKDVGWYARETLYQGELMLYLSAWWFGILLSLGELFFVSVLFQGDLYNLGQYNCLSNDLLVVRLFTL